jgi:membrane-associated phospholipid phosphatase
MQPGLVTNAFNSLAIWITSLGSESFFLLIAPAIYWCLSPRIGLRIGAYLIVSEVVNSLLKLAFHDPRPYWVDPEMRVMAGESSFGMPSGHAQNAVVVWGGIAATLKSRAAWIISVALMLLIGLSRIYIGVHSVDDVLVGWLVGALLLWMLIKLEPIVILRLRRHTLARQFAIAALLTVFMVALGLLIQWVYAGWELPQAWIDNAAARFPDLDPINPASIESIITKAGLFFGFAVGAMWIWSRGGFRRKAP